MSYICISDTCRDQIINMAYLKKGYIPVLDTCRYGLYNCDSPKYRYRQYPEGGVGINGTAIVPDYLLQDTFAGSGLLSSHMPEIGGSWTTLNNIIVEDGFAKFEQSLSSGAQMITDLTVGNAIINTSLTFDPNFGSGMNFYFNRISSQNTWGVYHSPPYIWLFKAVDGFGNIVDNAYEGTFGYSTLNITIEANDDNVKVYRDSELIIDHTELNRSHKTASTFAVVWFKTSGYLWVNHISAIGII